MLRFVALLFALPLLLLLMTACQGAPGSFDTQAWLAASPASAAKGQTRVDMAQTVVDRHLRQGMRRPAVHTLLGAPDFQDSARDVWDLGFPPLRMDMATLVVEYDDSGTLRQARVQLN